MLAVTYLPCESPLQGGLRADQPRPSESLMAFDTPATIALLGAGPIGLEAALYARFLGYQVHIYEQGGVAENVRRWGHARMFTPFSMNCSTLGRAALLAQDERYQAPGDDACLTGHEWVDRYLVPLSQTDLLADELRLDTTVLAVSRWGATKGEWIGGKERAETPFRLLVRDRQGNEREESADIVIDATGVYRQPKWIGPGGAPALGERPWRDRIQYHLPDASCADLARYANRRTLLIGSGHSAATAVVVWSALAAEHEQTQLVWLTKRPAEFHQAATPPSDDIRISHHPSVPGRSSDASPTASRPDTTPSTHSTALAPPGPIILIANDPLPERARLAWKANELVAQAPNWLEHHAGCQIRAVQRHGEDFVVRLAEQANEREWDERCDEIVALVGYRGDWEPLSELQVHLCYASEGPMKLAAQLLRNRSADCLTAGGYGPESLMTPEPNFYVLGAKSYGRNPQFLFAEGLRQIRDLFSVIGDRAELDLYANARSLPR
jgi:hypothetical protein